jgi:hypothetical protein
VFPPRLDRRLPCYPVTSPLLRRPSLFSAPGSFLFDEPAISPSQWTLRRNSRVAFGFPSVPGSLGGLPGSPLSVPLPVVGEDWGYLLPLSAVALRSESSSLVVFTPPPPAVSPPLFVVGGLEMELFIEAKPWLRDGVIHRGRTLPLGLLPTS